MSRKFVLLLIAAGACGDPKLEVGVYAEAKDGLLGKPLYLRMHRIHSGDQRITVTVPAKPTKAGIDPRNLLIDVEPNDNVQPLAP